ncbi:MAG TPA: NAD(P)-binding domain-containing protein [Clostridia bacterium]
MNIGVVGAGMMGCNIVKSAAKSGCVKVFDVDFTRASNAAYDFGQIACKSFDDLLDCEVIFLAVPGSAVIPLLNDYINKTENALWINISTLLNQEHLKNSFPEARNILSIKIIGQAGSMTNGMMPVIIVDPVYGDVVTREILDILGEVGEVVFDYEKKYLDVNMYAAEAAMVTAATLAEKLFAMNIDKKAIHAAIKGVFTGTAAQFPYGDQDYFHKLVFVRHPDMDFSKYFLSQGNEG